jgi:hypothetical protein
MIFRKALKPGKRIILTQANQDSLSAYAVNEEFVVADWHDDQSSIEMSFRNHSDKRRRARARRLNLPVGHEVSVSAHRSLHKLMIDEGRVSEAQRKIDS